MSGIYPSGEDAAQFIKVGVVSSVDRKKCTVKVLFEDCDETVSHDLSVVVRHTFKSKSYWLPDVGETVLCMFLPNGEETGYVLGSVYSEVDKPPAEISEAGKDRDGIWFEDGSIIKYESDTNTLVIDIQGEINIRATGNVNINGKQIHLNS